MVTTEYCVPGPLRRLSSAGTIQYFSSAGVGEGLSVYVGVGDCTWVGVGSSVGVGVTVPVDAILQAVSKTIQIMKTKRDLIFHTPLVE